MSDIVMIVGPVEYWWDVPEEPNRFMSRPAVRYRNWREEVSNFFEVHDFLVYRHWGAFRGEWDVRAQVVNDAIVRVADLIIDITPLEVPHGTGSKAELKLARELNKKILRVIPGADLHSLRDILGVKSKNVVPEWRLNNAGV